MRKQKKWKTRAKIKIWEEIYLYNNFNWFIFIDEDQEIENLRESSINFTNNSVITNSQVESSNNLSQNETVIQAISIPEKINEINGKYI